MRRAVLAALAAGLLLAPALVEAQDKGKNPVVVLKTSMGTIKIELYPDEAPITVKSFATTAAVRPEISP